MPQHHPDLCCKVCPGKVLCFSKHVTICEFFNSASMSNVVILYEHFLGISIEKARMLEEENMVLVDRGYGCPSTNEYFIQVYEYQGASSNFAR